MSTTSVGIYFLNEADLLKTEYFSLEHLALGHFCEG
jgi:hypothetical protein